MTRLEATDLAVRILQRFNGPPADVWEETLEDLEAGRANTALARLTREHANRWLSVAEFRNAYRALHTAMPTDTRIGPDPDGIGLAEYLERLARRAVTSQDAADELANWERWLSKGNAL